MSVWVQLLLYVAGPTKYECESTIITRSVGRTTAIDAPSWSSSTHTCTSNSRMAGSQSRRNDTATLPTEAAAVWVGHFFPSQTPSTRISSERKEREPPGHIKHDRGLEGQRSQGSAYDVTSLFVCSSLHEHNVYVT